VAVAVAVAEAEAEAERVQGVVGRVQVAVQGVVGRVQVAVQALVVQEVVVQEVAGWRPEAEQGPLASMLRYRHHRSQSR